MLKRRFEVLTTRIVIAKNVSNGTSSLSFRTLKMGMRMFWEKLVILSFHCWPTLCKYGFSPVSTRVRSESLPLLFVTKFEIHQRRKANLSDFRRFDCVRTASHVRLFLPSMVAVCRRRLFISGVVSILLLVILLVYARSFDDGMELRLTLVDYRWEPIPNLLVRLEITKDQLARNYSTNAQGQLVVDLRSNRDRIDYIHLLAEDIDERILPTGNEITLRLLAVHRDTGETYDDLERFTWFPIQNLGHFPDDSSCRSRVILCARARTLSYPRGKSMIGQRR